MPQANITYDTEYNRRLVAKERKNVVRTKLNDQPTEFPMRLGTFHDPHQKPVLLGGGPPREYIVNGNSPAYPPMHMRSGMDVSSGGAYIGVDGAVGGGFWKDFARGFTGVLDIASAPLALIAPPVGVGIGALSQGVKGLAGSGTSGGAMSGGVTSGAGFWSDFGKGFKKGFFGTLKLATEPLKMLAPKLAPVLDITNKLGELAGEGMSGGALMGMDVRDLLKRGKKEMGALAPVAAQIFRKGASPFAQKALLLANRLSQVMPAGMMKGSGLPEMEGGLDVAGLAKQLAPLLPFAMKFLKGSGMCRCSGGSLDTAMQGVGDFFSGLNPYSQTSQRKRTREIVYGKGTSGGASSGGGLKEDVMGLVESSKPYLKKGISALVGEVKKRGRKAVETSKIVKAEGLY